MNWLHRLWRKPKLVTITPEQLDRAMVAYRRGARMTNWEMCIDHSADRTLAGLRAALTEIGFVVERRKQ